MKKIFKFAWVGLLLPMLLPNAVAAETVMEKVARTGFLTVGTRFDTIPYAYINDRGELVGYSIDVLERVRARLQSILGRPVTIQTIEAKNPGETINLLRTGDIDIACGTSFTWERAKVVDFSTSYSISGIRLLTKKGSNLSTPESLAGKRVAVIGNSVAGDVIKLVQPGVNLTTTYETVEEGMAALKANRIDAIAGDSVILAGTMLQDNPKDYQIVPEEPFSRFGVGCIVPENNSTFLDEVNFAIVKMMQDYVTGDPKTVQQVDRWIGKDGIVPIPADLVRGFFTFTIIEHAQINPDSK